MLPPTQLHNSRLGAEPPRAAADASPKLKVFVSYSRRDLAFVEPLVAALELAGFEAYLDRKDIAAAEEWQARLGNLILAADTIVFVLSPDSIASRICAWEVAEAERLSKRIVPVVHRAIDADATPAGLKRLNYIFSIEDGQFDAALKQLTGALKTDLAWIREHTRVGEAAARWEARGRPEALLWRGNELSDVKIWMARRPRDAPKGRAWCALRVDPSLHRCRRECRARASARPAAVRPPAPPRLRAPASPSAVGRVFPS